MLCDRCEAKRFNELADEEEEKAIATSRRVAGMYRELLNLQVVMPYADQIEDVLEPQQRALFRSMIVDKNLDMTGSSYSSRLFGLRVLGFASYRDYCASDLYRAVRQVAFSVKGNYCVCCESPAIQIHHRRYSLVELLGLDFEQLEPICDACHAEIEMHAIGKRSLRMANMFLDKKIAEFNARLPLLGPRPL